MSRLPALLLALSVVLPLTATAGPASEIGPATVDEDLLEGEMPRSIIVSTSAPVDAALADELAEHGELLTPYSVIDGAHMRATPDGIRQLATHEAVQRVDADEELAWHLGTSRPAVGITDEVWRETDRGSNNTVAVVDTGIDASHPALRDRVQHGVTFTGGGDSQEMPSSSDTDGHGTHVAGVVASTGEGSKLLDGDNRRYAGVSPGAGLVALDISQSFSTSTAIDAFDWVHNNHEEHGITVVQNSWGRKEVGQAYDPGDPAIRASNTLVGEDDLVVVFSAANKGPEPRTLSLEAMNPSVLSVAAVDTTGEAASFSSRGPVVLPNGSEASWVKPDVAAPGVQIKSAAAGAQDNWITMSGTSQAAPHVSGVAALLQNRFDDLSAPAVHEILRTSARDLGEEGPDPVTGYGFVHAPSALRQASRAENGTLFTTTETYEAKGTLTPPNPGDGLLPEDSGADAGTANGTIPVKDGARRLAFTATWAASQDGLTTPDIEVELLDPAESSMLLETSEGQANRTIEDPNDGEWEWRIHASGVGAVDYEMNGTVTLERDLLGAAAGDAGGFFQDGPGAQAQEMFERAVDAYGLAPVAAGLALALVTVAAVGRAIVS